MRYVNLKTVRIRLRLGFNLLSIHILIDCNFEAKVADFGLAKCTSDVATHVSTRYLASEFTATVIGDHGWSVKAALAALEAQEPKKHIKDIVMQATRESSGILLMGRSKESINQLHGLFSDINRTRSSLKIAQMQGLTTRDEDTVKGVYQKFVNMIVVYHETSQIQWTSDKGECSWTAQNRNHGGLDEHAQQQANRTGTLKEKEGLICAPLTYEGKAERVMLAYGYGLEATQEVVTEDRRDMTAILL
ncbi:RNA pseudouridine synthase 3, mitochondrial [Artemisia annua]|uniref:RNA pseudouridine synthase 3, mitochondrial n=1 Tax=Artemisia annua TaxID=35608 RepID=A0A2U1PLA1_ARTAN|nr:RNA pseudouridine synthase 3, mitochondrial [Artemisia annua]